MAGWEEDYGSCLRRRGGLEDPGPSQSLPPSFPFSRSSWSAERCGSEGGEITAALVLSELSKMLGFRFSFRAPNYWALLAFPLPTVGQRGRPEPERERERISRPRLRPQAAHSPLPTALRKTSREQRSRFALKENSRRLGKLRMRRRSRARVDRTAFPPPPL